eukprot:scaffold21.g2160.t1
MRAPHPVLQSAAPSSTAALYARPQAAARLPRARRQARVLAGVVNTLLKPLTSSGERKPLKEGIAQFYDESSALWESVWGEHMHHGYYPKDGPPKSNQQAQVDMVDQVLDWAGVEAVRSCIDVGCGIGGSSRHIARRFGAASRGITLSPVQAARATQLTEAAGLGDRVSFQVADALQQPFGDGSFDLVWSLESGEHMPDKQRFVGELVRVCAPGGRVIVVAPFWAEVIRSALTARGLSGLLKAGWTTIKGALVMPLMAQGLRRGLIEFVLITGRKPQ